MLFACLFTLFAGCATPANPTDPTITESVLFNGMTDFVAAPFADCGLLSGQYSIKVKVVDGKVYLNDISYQKISDDGFEISNTNAFFYCHVEGKDAVDFLENLKNSEMLCLLEAESKSSIGQQIVIYDIDNTYYFLSFYDSGEIVRIHYVEYTKGG